MSTSTTRQRRQNRQSSLSARRKKKGGGGKGGAIVEQEAEEIEALYPSSEARTSILPKMLVFDLDNTLWTPELFQIRQRDIPTVGRDIRLFHDVKIILHDLHVQAEQHWQDTELAIASRTHKREWALELLKQFEAAPGTAMADLFPHVQVIRGSKKVHFDNLRKNTNIPYSDMLFFDDDANMNLEEISQLGVLCCHCPRGLTVDLFRGALEKYQTLHQDDLCRGMTLTEKSLGITPSLSGAQGGEEEGRRTKGKVKFFSEAKRFGFVVEDSGSGDYFFHESKVPQSLSIRAGMKVEFQTSVDSQGRNAAVILGELDTNGAPKSVPSKGKVAQMKCFTMSQPFAALLLNGIKTVESRNNPMFMDIPSGTRILLHCGKKDWKDLEQHKRELVKAGYSQEEIEKFSRLPSKGGFTRGSIIGVVTVGESFEASPSERRDETLQRKVVADFENVGRFCTPILEAQWLKRPCKARGNPGVYTVDIVQDCVPPSETPEGQETGGAPREWSITEF